MQIILLKFSDNRASAPDFMAEHNAWIAKGFADGVFQTTGSLQPAAGGVLLAHGEDRDALEMRVNADPFVAHGVVTAEIIEVDVKRAVPALEFMMSAA